MGGASWGGTSVHLGAARTKTWLRDCMLTREARVFIQTPGAQAPGILSKL